MTEKIPPFKHIVDNHFCFTDEYKEWAVKAENYPGSSLQIEDVGCHQRIRKFKSVKADVEFVETTPTASRDASRAGADVIRQYGGFAKVTTCMRNKRKLYIVWFNPNGSNEAREWVAGW